jgi:hypothetical protein
MPSQYFRLNENTKKFLLTVAVIFVVVSCAKIIKKHPLFTFFFHSLMLHQRCTDSIKIGFYLVVFFSVLLRNVSAVKSFLSIFTWEQCKGNSHLIIQIEKRRVDEEGMLQKSNEIGDASNQCQKSFGKYFICD